MDIHHEILKQYWGYDTFRPLQEDIIRSISSGKDTLGLMPTGGGKSLTFQVPTMAMEGLCIVVTPLIALMKDQVDNLREKGIKALCVYSGMTRQEILTTLENAIYGNFKFLYVSPERLNTEMFLAKLRFMNVSMLVVDESHCISQWGYDFRPSYLKIADIRALLPNVPVLALTATATPSVVDDIQERLHFSEKNVFKKSFIRENLVYRVRTTENKWNDLLKALERVKGSAIVYVRNRKNTKEVSDYLQSKGLSSDFYHAGLNSRDKVRKQDVWKTGASRIIVCTNAFGMGIDKPDVRLVVHLDLPNSIEEYYQEAGRAGRDGKRAYAIILYTKSDSSKLKKRVKDEFPDRDFILQVYENLAYFFQIAEGYGLGLVRDFNIMQFCSIYKMPVLQTHNALKILDLAGYIEYTDELNNRSRLIFTIYRDELYSYNFDRDNEHLVNTILRLYTGLFSSYATINEDEVGLRIGKKRKEVYEMLKLLAKRNIIDYIPHKKTPLIAYKRSRQDVRHVQIPKLVYEDRQERFGLRVKAMADYVESNDICRNNALVSYLGEKVDKDCGWCDVCQAKNASGLTNAHFNEITSALAKLLPADGLSVQSIVSALSIYTEKDVMTIIRHQLDNGNLICRLDTIFKRE